MEAAGSLEIFFQRKERELGLRARLESRASARRGARTDPGLRRGPGPGALPAFLRRAAGLAAFHPRPGQDSALQSLPPRAALSPRRAGALGPSPRAERGARARQARHLGEGPGFRLWRWVGEAKFCPCEFLGAHAPTPGAAFQQVRRRVFPRGGRGPLRPGPASGRFCGERPHAAGPRVRVGGSLQFPPSFQRRRERATRWPAGSSPLTQHSPH